MYVCVCFRGCTLGSGMHAHAWSSLAEFILSYAGMTCMCLLCFSMGKNWFCTSIIYLAHHSYALWQGEGTCVCMCVCLYVGCMYKCGDTQRSALSGVFEAGLLTGLAALQNPGIPCVCLPGTEIISVCLCLSPGQAGIHEGGTAFSSVSVVPFLLPQGWMLGRRFPWHMLWPWI